MVKVQLWPWPGQSNARRGLPCPLASGGPCVLTVIKVTTKLENWSCLARLKRSRPPSSLVQDSGSSSSKVSSTELLSHSPFNRLYAVEDFSVFILRFCRPASLDILINRIGEEVKMKKHQEIYHSYMKPGIP